MTLLLVSVPATLAALWLAGVACDWLKTERWFNNRKAKQ